MSLPAGTTTLVLLAAALGVLGGRRWPTPASGVDERERALRRDGSADVALPSRRLEEATSAGHCKLDRSCAYSIDEDAKACSNAVTPYINAKQSISYFVCTAYEMK